MNTNKKSAIAVSAILLFSFISMIPFNNQMAYAQNSATVNNYFTGDSSDVVCPHAVEASSGFVWIACNFTDSSTTVRLKAMNGNTTIASTTFVLASPNAGYNIFPFGDNVIISPRGGNPTLTQYRVNGASISSVNSLTVSGCNVPTSTYPFATFNNGVLIPCTDGNIRFANFNTMTVTDSFSGLQGSSVGGLTCTAQVNIFFISSTRGVGLCDSNELFSYTISGSTITAIDSVTLNNANSFNRFFFTAGFVWLSTSDTVTNRAEFVSLSSSNIFGTPTLLSSQTGVSGITIISNTYIASVSNINDNIIVYDLRLDPINGAVANFNIGTLGKFADISSVNTGNIIISGGTSANGTFYVVNNIFIDGSLITGIPPTTDTGGIDCNSPENVNILICRLTSQTGGNIGGLGGILDTGIFNIFTNSGIIDGTDTNPQTNGVGYFITASAFALMIGVFFVASKNNLDRIPNYIYMIVSIAILGGLTAIGWIDPTLLILGAIIISGLAVAKYRDVLSGSFGGGDFR